MFHLQDLQTDKEMGFLHSVWVNQLNIKHQSKIRKALTNSA